MSESTSESNLDFIIPTGAKVWVENLRLGILFAVEIILVYIILTILLLTLIVAKKVTLTPKFMVNLFITNINWLFLFLCALIGIDVVFRGAAIKYCDGAISGNKELFKSIRHLKYVWKDLFLVETLFCISVLTPVIFFLSNIKRVNVSLLAVFSVMLIGWFILNLIISMYLPISVVLGNGPLLKKLKDGIDTLLRNFGKSIALLLLGSALQLALLSPLQVLRFVNVYLAFIYMVVVISFILEPLFTIWLILVYRKTLNLPT